MKADRKPERWIPLLSRKSVTCSDRHRPHSRAFADGRYLFAVDLQGVHVTDTQSGQLLRTIPSHDARWRPGDLFFARREDGRNRHPDERLSS